MPTVLLINGSLRGADGNTGWLVQEAARRVAGRAGVDILHLADGLPAMPELVERVRAADALLVATGVYWHGWGSPLQRLIEVLTPWENTDLFLAKPVGALITMDSVGGGELGARLLGVFNQLGCAVPPCSTLILSRVAVEALARGPHMGNSEPDEDVWQLGDLDTVLHNVLAPLTGEAVRPWPFRPLHAPTGDYPQAGRLDLGSPRFLPPR